MARGLLLIVLILALAGPAGAGLDEGLTAYKRGDFRAAREAWVPLAEAGDREAQYFLGHLYAKGEGVAQDHGLALHWFRAAAAQGDPYGQFALGYLFEHGRGVVRDDRAAVRWYQVAAEQGNPAAQNNLGLMYERGRGVPRDYVTAYLWYARAASGSGPDRYKAARNLEQVTPKMTPAQIAAAKRLLNEGAR